MKPQAGDYKDLERPENLKPGSESAFAWRESGKPFREEKKTVHQTEIRTPISPSSAVELNTTSVLANFSIEAGSESAFAWRESGKPFREEKKTVHQTEIRTPISPSSAVELNTTSVLANFSIEAVNHIKMTESLHLQGTLKGHNGWVTQIATNPNYSDMVLSCSRGKMKLYSNVAPSFYPYGTIYLVILTYILMNSDDRSLILWKLSRSEHNLGLPQKRLLGHNHFVSDIAISTDGHFALSGSWDRSLRLWDLGQGTSTRQFVDHKKDVMSVAFSADNRQIVSGSRDKSLKLWNTLAHCKFTMQDEGHADWVSCVRFSPNIQNPIIVSCGWDKKVKDSKVMLWDLNEDKHLYTLENKDVINALCFSPNRYWLCAAVGPYIKIWDLEGKLVIDELCPEVVSQYSGRETEPPQCLCMSWSGDGQTLFAGYSDSVIRAWQAACAIHNCLRMTSLRNYFPSGCFDQEDLNTGEIHLRVWRREVTNPLQSVSRSVVGYLSSHYSNDAESVRQSYARAFSTTLSVHST
uniref:Small ribosomal subunit protein RACK1 n=1 Tax=Timema californicum TaxID=61474 RepID=A0A7R9P6X8_TIMCA|nr:unnamed protein product [Timema californicum]